jgi:hypothetical protein
MYSQQVLGKVSKHVAKKVICGTLPHEVSMWSYTKSRATLDGRLTVLTYTTYNRSAAANTTPQTRNISIILVLDSETSFLMISFHIVGTQRRDLFSGLIRTAFFVLIRRCFHSPSSCPLCCSLHSDMQPGTPCQKANEHRSTDC